MSKEIAVPDNIAKMLAASGVASTTDMDTGSGGVPRISLKKSKFTAKIGEDETKLGDTINVVIVGIDPPQGFAKSFYLSGYTPGASDAPDCQSSDGISPDSFVDIPISSSCRTCEKNQWGSAKSMSGKKAKACKDSKRLHVVLAEDLGKEEPTIYILVVTVLSLKPFGEYGKILSKEGIPSPSIVITQLSFDDEASVPKLEFTNVGMMDEANCKASIKIASEKPWEFADVNSAKAIEAPTNNTVAIEPTSTPPSKDLDSAVDNW